MIPTELMIAIVTSTVAAVGSIICAVITSGASKRQDKANKDAMEYREKREKLDVAKNKVLLSTMEGVLVLLRQAKGDKLNGNVEAAIDSIVSAKDDLTEVRSEIAAQL